MFLLGKLVDVPLPAGSDATAREWLAQHNRTREKAEIERLRAERGELLKIIADSGGLRRSDHTARLCVAIATASASNM